MWFGKDLLTSSGLFLELTEVEDSSVGGEPPEENKLKFSLFSLELFLEMLRVDVELAVLAFEIEVVVCSVVAVEFEPLFSPSKLRSESLIHFNSA